MVATTTPPGDGDVAAFLNAVTPDRRRDEARRLDALFREVTGFRPVLWGGRLLGYGAYDYTYASGRSGRWMATGFGPKKANTVIHILPGYADFSHILADLGPHRRGKSCVYIGALDKVDEGALARLIRAGLEDLATHWPVQPT